MIYATIFFGIVGCVSGVMGVLNFLAGRKSKNILKELCKLMNEAKKQELELVNRIRGNAEQYRQLLPYVKGVVENNAKMETYLSSPTITDFLEDIPTTGRSNWSDILKEDVFVAGQPQKWSDLLAIKIVSPSQ